MTNSKAGTNNGSKQAIAQAVAAALARQKANRRNVSANAKLRSIPRSIVPKKERFDRGTPASSISVAPRGHGYYDAFSHRPESLVLASQVGPCTPIEGFGRITIAGTAGTTGTGTYNSIYEDVAGTTHPHDPDNSALLVFNPGASGETIARVFRLEETSAGLLRVSKADIDVKAFAGLANQLPDQIELGDTNMLDDPLHQNQPNMRTASIPIRGSMKMRNVTEAMAVGGEVRFLRYNGGMNLTSDIHGGTNSGAFGSEMDVDTYDAICEMVRDSSRTLSKDGHELKVTHQSNTYPADVIRSMTFEQDSNFLHTVRFPSYCTLFVLIDNFKSSSSGVNNTYSLAFNVQRAARFAPGTLLHNMSITPATSSDTHSKATASESASAPSFVRQVADYYAADTKRQVEGFKDAATFIKNTVTYDNVNAAMPYIRAGMKLLPK
jgi:hypothetical protein